VSVPVRDLTEWDFDDLLNEVLFEYSKQGYVSAEDAEPTLDATVRKVARRERYAPSDADVRALAALAYEQLAHQHPGDFE
jgi:hypothetical protein